MGTNGRRRRTAIEDIYDVAADLHDCKVAGSVAKGKKDSERRLALTEATGFDETGDSIAERTANKLKRIAKLKRMEKW